MREPFLRGGLSHRLKLIKALAKQVIRPPRTRAGSSLVSQLRTDVETAVRQGRINDKLAGQLMQFYESGMQGYTYLESGPE